MLPGARASVRNLTTTLALLLTGLGVSADWRKRGTKSGSQAGDTPALTREFIQDLCRARIHEAIRQSKRRLVRAAF